MSTSIRNGDLDLVIAQYAATAEQALRLPLEPKLAPVAGSGLVVYLNVGEAKAVNPSEDPALCEHVSFVWRSRLAFSGRRRQSPAYSALIWMTITISICSFWQITNFPS